MLSFGHVITMRLKRRFPKATVTYNLDGYWDVRYSDEFNEYIDSYKLQGDKLVLFSSFEFEV